MTSEGYPGWSYPKPLICTTIRKPDGDIQHYIQHIITDRAVVVTANIEKPKFVTTVVTLVHRNMPVCGAICLRYPVRITCYITFNILERCLSIIWSDGNESSCVVSIWDIQECVCDYFVWFVLIIVLYREYSFPEPVLSWERNQRSYK